VHVARMEESRGS